MRSLGQGLKAASLFTALAVIFIGLFDDVDGFLACRRVSYIFKDQRNQRPQKHNPNCTMPPVIESRRKSFIENMRHDKALGRMLAVAHQSDVLKDPSDDGISIRNFRSVLGMDGLIFRCGETDRLGKLFMNHGSLGHEKSAQANILLEQTGLTLDLRSPSERDEILAQAWMKQVNAKIIEYDSASPPPLSSFQIAGNDGPTVLRMDLLSTRKLFGYMEEYWFTPYQKLQAVGHKVFNMEALHAMRMDTINMQGLPGLYEAILETAQDELCHALQIMTSFLEQQQESGHARKSVVVHCVQGKDR
jgi:hypothetical protein